MRARLYLILALLTVVSITSSFDVARGQREPVAKIAALYHPSRVLPGQSFSVNVTVSYAYEGWTIADLGIYDPNEVFFHDTIRYYLSGNGSQSFTFKLNAPRIEKILALEAVTRYWFADSWLSTDGGARAFSIIISSKVYLTVETPYPKISVKIDDSELSTSDLGTIRKDVVAGNHKVEVPRVVLVGPGTRSVFFKWSDGSTSNPRIIRVEGDLSITALYATRFYLRVDSPYGTPFGDGWYDGNSTANFSVVSTVVAGGLFGLLGGRYIFEEWRGDSTSKCPTASLVVTKPTSVSASWRVDYTFPCLTAILSLGAAVICLIANLDLKRVRRRSPVRYGPTRKR